MQVHECTSINVGKCHTTSTIDISYSLINLHGNDIVIPIISSKPRLRARFGSTLIKYAFMSTPSKVGLNIKVMYRNTTGQANKQT